MQVFTTFSSLFKAEKSLPFLGIFGITEKTRPLTESKNTLVFQKNDELLHVLWTRIFKQELCWRNQVTNSRT